MTVLIKRWYRSRRNQVVVVISLLSCLIYYTTVRAWEEPGANLDVTRRGSVIDYIEKRLQEALRFDKGTGCEIPNLDPFDKEVLQFDKNLPKVTCEGKDWVKCYHSECRVKKEVLDTTKDIICSYSDILYESDLKYTIGSPVDVYGSDPYILTRSDHVKVKCSGRHIHSILPSKWVGVAIGYRNSVRPPPPPPGREDTVNVLIFGFDSTSKNGFIRRMPKSYAYLKDMKATFLNGYNIVGDGTPAALFPILSGKTELEMPDVRKKMHNNNTLDTNAFIFNKLRADGYRTAYFEDSPSIGTFQYRFNGFREQPSDHYLRAFFLEDRETYGKNKAYCVGDTPRYRLLLEITEQFLKLDRKKYIFTFIADITHDDFNRISTADEDTVKFLKNFKESGRMKDTIMFVMGDHGPRYAAVRKTLQGRLEERLPLMAVRLPDSLVSRRPSAQVALEANADVLTTPHDIYATVMDALDLKHYWNTYTLKGADMPRAMTLLQPIEVGLPLMAVSLPDSLVSRRPSAQNALEANADVLTTPHDIYATVMDALDLKHYWNTYTLKGADMPRAMTLLQPIEVGLPLIAVRLPDSLVSRRPSAQVALEANADVLTTPHDIYATVMDALDLKHYWNTYTLKGADMPRAMTLLQPIPKNRSCSEAAIEPHWCACVSWKDVARNDPMFQRVADAVLAFINQLTEPVRSLCIPRTLTNISWVMKQKPNDGVLSFKESKDPDGYVGKFGPSIDVNQQIYQAKITVGPGEGVFEASVTYRKKEDKFDADIRDISRTNMYHHEPDCIHLKHPHLNMFCYCKNQTPGKD